MKRTLLNLTYVGVGCLLALFVTQWIPSYGKDERTQPKIAVDDTPVNRDAKFSTSFAPIIKKAGPSVVNISSTRTIRGRDLRMNPLFNDPFFRQFFGDPEQLQPRDRREQSLGSGVIVAENGYVLTSNHVIEGADEIRTVLSSGQEYTAKVIGTDPSTDTAVLKVDATGLPAITLANSEKLEVGDVVLAIGNPFGLGQTVTMGIVSATGRGELGILGPGGYEDFIQTDASINPGNSGGALVDAEGRLVGINTAILSRTGGNMGVGFAIPINMSRHVMDKLISNGKVERGFLGVALYPLTLELAERLELKDTSGALVAGVEEGTPAAEAGFKPYDVITEFNGKKVANDRQLRLMVSQTPPKSKATFKVLRDGKTRTFEVTLAVLPTEGIAGGFRRPGELPSKQGETLEGVEVTDLDARSRRQHNIPNHIHGALVSNVDPASPAYEEGLRPGDVILEIERKPVENAEQAVELSENFKGDRVLLRVWSRVASGFLFMDIDRESDKEKREKEDEK